jgi:septal ring factor EnvC (AmiA/AmiB activator)
MAWSMSLPLTIFLVCASTTSAVNQATIAHERSLQQEWEGTLNGAHAGHMDTPVTRVVNLLKEMQQTIKAEQDEDEELFHKLGCWCNDNTYEKDGAIEAGEAKIKELEATIESLTAKIEELKTTLKELRAQLATDKADLAEATALREKEAKAFHGKELDNIQAIENMKAALTVLSKHHQGGPESTVEGGAVFKSERDSWESLIAVKAATTKNDHVVHYLEDFMRRNGFDAMPEQQASKFLQQEPHVVGWSDDDAAVVKRALKYASSFLQDHQGYRPAYTARSGEIVGVLKQLKEEMEGDLGEAQKKEQDAAAAFSELRAAKTEQIESAEKMEEEKEDDLANSENALAEAKEDLEQEKKLLAENQKFLKNLKELCTDADKKFQERKSMRLQEIQAVSETIEILTADEARDAMTGTYSFLQNTVGRVNKNRKMAAKALRLAAAKNRDPRLSALATSVELDAFTKVKKAIDDMITMLKQQMEDEVKKSDYCKKELQENEMSISKTTDEKASLEAHSAKLSEDIKALEDAIAAASAEIDQLRVALQRASEDRLKENIEFQKTIADQTMTVGVLKKAMERLAKFYDESLLQKNSKQTPPVPQMEYKKSAGAGGVMQMIEKLVQEAKDLIATSKTDEQSAQDGYEATVADTNDSVAALQKEITTKTKAKVAATKEKQQTEADIADAATELDGLNKYNSELHADCDYVLKNFDVRQKARGEEIEALQQAKQILSGANLS